MAAFDQNKLDTLQNDADTLSSRLSDSRTAYAPNTPPTGSDLSMDAQLKGVQNSIEQLKAQRIRDQWYGTDSNATSDSGPSEGLISKGLTMLGKPLDAVVGAAESILGKGTKSGFFENINSNLDEHQRFGSLLQKFNVPSLVSKPLGFALDVALDPVNWLTMGTQALIPRVGAGLVKGAMKGGLSEGVNAAKTGLISNLEKKAISVLPNPESTIGKFFTGGSEKYKNFIDTLGEKSVAGSQKYNTMIGSDIYDNLGKGIFGVSDLNSGKTLGSGIESFVRSKVPGGNSVVDFLKYSPLEQNKVVNLKDRVTQLAKNSGIILVNDKNTGEGVFKSINEIKNSPGGVRGSLKDHLNSIMDNLGNSVAELPKVSDTFENAKQLLDTAKEDYNLKHLVSAYEETPFGKTGVKFYDVAADKVKSITVDNVLEKAKVSGLLKNNALYNKVKDVKPFEKFLNTYQTFINTFKLAKVPGSPSSFVYSTAGNTAFAAMAGIPIHDSRYLRSVLDQLQFLRGKQGAEYIKSTFFNDFNSYTDLLEKNPDLFRSTFGFSPKTIAGKYAVEGALDMKGAVDFSKMKETLSDYLNRAEEAVKKVAEIEKNPIKSAEESLMVKTLKSNQGARPSSLDTVKQMMKEGPIKGSELPGGWAASELTGKIPTVLDKLKEISAANKSKSMTHWMIDKVVNGLPDAYSYSDQSFKLGNTKYLTHVGLSPQNLQILSRIVPITKDDLLVPIREGGELMYRLKPNKATEAANEIYMNYAAMPGMVKVMRALPILGSPFISFSYAMASKTGKTLLHNPAIFTKIQSLLNEIGGERSPLEKKALEDKYNAYLKSPGMLRLGQSMNINVANLIPYLSMNMFMPSDRKYNNTFPDNFLKFMDNTPMLKDPIGQTIFDYIVQPSILSQGEQPQGQFGQPLYPIGSSLGKQALYAARSAAESVVPGVASFSGLPAGILGIPPEVTNFVPSYRWRQLANAPEGRDTLGAASKEDATSRTFRTLLSTLGVQLHPLDLTYLSSQSKPKK